MVDGHEIIKQIEIKLIPRTLFANSLTARDLITFSGQNVVDSFNSNDGPYDPFFNRGAEASVGSDTVNLGTANIYGYVATGSGGEATVDPDGFVSDMVDPPEHDPDRITNDFNSNFPVSSAPTMTSPITSLPEPVSDIITIGSTLPDPPTEEYHLSDISLGGDTELRIVGPIIIIADDGVSVGGSAKIRVTSDGSVSFYTPKDFCYLWRWVSK